MNTAAAEVLDKIGVEGIDPTQVVNFMPFEERKLLEVARAECAEPQLLIIDETTTALGREGRDVMYRLINKMRDGNRSVLFISHDIEELMDICDSIIVLRDGHYIGALNREEMTVGALRQMMVGREIADNFYRSDWNGRLTDEVALSARDICYGPMKDLALDLHKGEILGIGGLTDCGMHDFGKILFGIIKPDYGTVKLSDGTGIANPKQAVKNHMAYISKNRDTEALMSAGSVKDNMCQAAGNVELVPVQIAGGSDGLQTTYENMINMGVDGILAVSFSEGSVRLLADLFEESDVDWFLVNRRLSDESLKEYVFSQSKLVGNEFCYEEETAYQMVKKLHEDYGVKNLAVIGLTQGDAAGDLRDQGLARACEEFGIKMLTETRGIASAGDVTNAVEGIISSYPEVDGLFIVGGNVTNGALAGASHLFPPI